MSTTARLLKVLLETGFLERDERTKFFELGPRCYYVGVMAQESGTLRRVALPIMQQLNNEFGETIVLYKTVGKVRVLYEQVKGTQRLNQATPPGDELPLCVGASGRCFLAYMSEKEIEENLATLQRYASNTILDKKKILERIKQVRLRGYDISTSERDEGITAVAAPILNYREEAVACIAITGPEENFTQEVIEKAIASIKKASSDISRAIK